MFGAKMLVRMNALITLEADVGQPRRMRVGRTQITRYGAAQYEFHLGRKRYRTAVTCAPHVGPVTTVRDGSRSTASAGRGRHSNPPGARVSTTETLIGRAYQQPRFAESDVRHSRRMTRTTARA